MTEGSNLQKAKLTVFLNNADPDCESYSMSQSDVSRRDCPSQADPAGFWRL